MSDERGTVEDGMTDTRQVLLIAYGNASRRDDGVAFHIVRRLRQRLGRPARDEDEARDEFLDESPAILATHQLGPELCEVMGTFEVVIFVDAHVEGTAWSPVHWQEISAVHGSRFVTHHLRPQTLLALCDSLYAKRPQAYILSVLGTDFGFGEELGAATSLRAEEAVLRLERFCQARCAKRNHPS